MALRKCDVLDSINELIGAMALFADRIGRDVELIVTADGTASLMGADGPNGFEEIERFDSIPELLEFLGAQEVPGGEAAAV